MVQDTRERDERLLRRAIELAGGSPETGGPFGAVVARDGDVLAEGRNLVVASRDPTAHAEVVAIREACRRLGTHVLAGCVVYASCEPCPMCLGAAWWARIDRLVVGASRDDAAAAGFDDAAIHDELARPVAMRSLRVDVLLREEASACLARWAADPRRVPY